MYLSHKNISTADKTVNINVPNVSLNNHVKLSINDLFLVLNMVILIFI